MLGLRHTAVAAGMVITFCSFGLVACGGSASSDDAPQRVEHVAYSAEPVETCLALRGVSVDDEGGLSSLKRDGRGSFTAFADDPDVTDENRDYPGAVEADMLFFDSKAEAAEHAREVHKDDRDVVAYGNADHDWREIVGIATVYPTNANSVSIGDDAVRWIADDADLVRTLEATPDHVVETALDATVAELATIIDYSNVPTVSRRGFLEAFGHILAGYQKDAPPAPEPRDPEDELTVLKQFGNLLLVFDATAGDDVDDQPTSRQISTIEDCLKNQAA
jgi:hypothetical protein